MHREWGVYNYVLRFYTNSRSLKLLQSDRICMLSRSIISLVELKLDLYKHCWFILDSSPLSGLDLDLDVIYIKIYIK